MPEAGIGFLRTIGAIYYRSRQMLAASRQSSISIRKPLICDLQFLRYNLVGILGLDA